MYIKIITSLSFLAFCLPVNARISIKQSPIPNVPQSYKEIRDQFYEPPTIIMGDDSTGKLELRNDGLITSNQIEVFNPIDCNHPAYRKLCIEIKIEIGKRN